MKLLRTYDLLADAEENSALLESKGIATFISSKRSYRLGSWFTGAFVVGLWVILDAQLDEAEKVLHDPRYSVVYALSPAEMESIKAEIRSGDLSRVLNFLVGVLVLLILLALAMRLLGIA